jgi:PAS domain S-box-containing protein
MSIKIKRNIDNLGAYQSNPKNQMDEDSMSKDILLISNDWIWEIDTSYKYTFTSGQIKEILGYAPEEIIGKSVFDIFDPDTRIRKEKELRRLMDNDVPIINRINWNIAKNGTKVCLVTNGIPIFNTKNEVIGYRGVDKNITQQKISEENLKQQIEDRKKSESSLMAEIHKMKLELLEKSHLLDKIGNNIRTPLVGILGTSALLEDTPLSLEQKDFLENIKISANNLLSTIHDIVDISNIDAGIIELDNKTFNLVEILNETDRLLSYKSKQKKIDFSIQIKSGLPKHVIGDPVRLKQILINLAHNAIKFTKKGHVKIIVEKISESQRNLKMLFSIIDTGIGISYEDQQKLFDGIPQTTHSKQFGNTGLGLLISKKITELMHGEMGVESMLEKGSKFWFTVELKKGNSPKIHALQNNGDSKQSNEKKLSVLIVEDNVINQKVAMANVKQLGHEAEVAVNGKMAVELFKNNNYDVILMDIQMPVMDGIAATKEIRKIEKADPKRKRTMIIAITANVLADDKEECKRAGMDHYIPKPFKIEDLNKLLESSPV